MKHHKDRIMCRTECGYIQKDKREVFMGVVLRNQGWDQTAQSNWVQYQRTWYCTSCDHLTITKKGKRSFAERGKRWTSHLQSQRKICYLLTTNSENHFYILIIFHLICSFVLTKTLSWTYFKFLLFNDLNSWLLMSVNAFYLSAAQCFIIGTGFYPII